MMTNFLNIIVLYMFNIDIMYSILYYFKYFNIAKTDVIFKSTNIIKDLTDLLHC